MKYATIILCLTVSAVAAQGRLPVKPANTWTLSKTVDRMTDGTKCMLLYAKDSNVWYTSGDVLVVSYFRRGGVSYYQYRIDDQRASEMVSKPYDDDLVMVTGADGSLIDGKQIMIDGATITRRAIRLTIDLTGLAQAREQMAAACTVYPIFRAEK